MAEKTTVLRADGRSIHVHYAPKSYRRLVSALTLSVLTAVFVFFHGFPGMEKFSNSTKGGNLCLSAACIHSSSEILYNLSPNYKNIDPCTNFEELVCRGWRDRHDLREDQGDAFTGTIMAENSQLLLRHILEAPYPKNSMHSYFSPLQLDVPSRSADEKNFEKMKAVYDACLNETVIKLLGVSPLMDILHRVEESFPTEQAADNVNPSDVNAIKETVLLLSKHGLSALLASGTGSDDKAPDNVVTFVSPPWRIGLPSKERYEDEELVKKYEEVLTRILSTFYPGRSTKSLSAVVDFEKKLAAALPSTEELEDITKTYNPFSLEDASALTPQIDLASLIKGLAPSNVTVDRLIVRAPSYMKELSHILSETRKDVLQNYFLWKVMQGFASYVEAEAVKPYIRFVNELAGKDPDSKPERWRTCVAHVDHGMGWILSRFFVERAFSARAKEFGDLIVSDIKDQFAQKLTATEWMEKSIISKAIEKVHNIVQKIGYPTAGPNITDPSSLHAFYASVNVTSSTFFDNELSMRRFAVSREWSALGFPVDKNEWGITVPTVNAYYNPPLNEIVFPAGIMQFPVFDVSVPSYLSYGAFGSVAGHELSHAFDSTGRHYDQNGNYKDWWTNATVAEFQKRAECFVEQYSNFTVPGPNDKPLHVNGRLTLGENIADAGGLSASFHAWKLRSASHPDTNLPGLDFFSQEQLFFVSYSNWWCGKSRPETAINRIYTDPHAPKWARILGTMANSREFRQAFTCESREPVCELW